MAASLLQQTTIMPTKLASYWWTQGCASLISCMLYCIYLKTHLIIISSYIVGYYHISWKTSLKSYNKVQRQINKHLQPRKAHALNITEYKYMIWRKCVSVRRNWAIKFSWDIMCSILNEKFIKVQQIDSYVW